MNNLLIIVVACLVVLGLLAGVLKGSSRRVSNERPKAKQPVSLNEQGMYNRLVQSLPGAVVLPQVSFGALLTARTMAVRNTFDRKIADFVVCTPAFNVLAIIELDDSSHRGKEAKDAKRDALLVGAGYRVLRYRGIPDIDKVQADFASLTGGPAQAASRRGGHRTANYSAL